MLDDINASRPRLVQRHIAIGECAQQALAVCRADTDGIVDGVSVDFRHPSLPPGEWEARAFWYVGNEGESNAGFLFPSEAKAMEAGAADREPDLLAEKLALPRANDGDRLTVERVKSRTGDRRFDHAHDATVKLAYLVLTRPNGEEVRPDTPLAFFGVTQLRDGPKRDAYDRLADRILSEHGNPDPHKFEVERMYRPIGEWRPSRDYSLSVRAAFAIADAERAWLNLKRDFLGDDPRANALLRQALGAATLAAFYQAKHESKLAEDRMQAVLAGGAKARSKAKASDNRVSYATDFWLEEPHLSLGKLSRKVLEKLYWNDDQALITEQAMKESLGRAIARGELIVPPQSPEYRP